MMHCMNADFMTSAKKVIKHPAQHILFIETEETSKMENQGTNKPNEENALILFE